MDGKTILGYKWSCRAPLSPVCGERVAIIFTCCQLSAQRFRHGENPSSKTVSDIQTLNVITYVGVVHRHKNVSGHFNVLYNVSNAFLRKRAMLIALTVFKSMQVVLKND